MPHPDSPTAGPAVSEAGQTPHLAGIRSSVRDGVLYLSGTMGPSRTNPVYDPDHAGGWMLQLFLNTDRADTGYPWMGIDYIVRGSERSPDGGSMVVRRIESGYGGPGDWGPQSGSAQFTERGRHFTVAVPLAALGDDDGGLDFVLETYATVACDECEGGVRHERTAGYFGVTRIPRPTTFVATSIPESEVRMLPAGRARSLATTRSDIDARW